MIVGTFVDPSGSSLVGEVVGDQVRELEAKSMYEWLLGRGRNFTDRDIALAELKASAPVPEPLAVRDFYAFEEHVASGARKRGMDIPEYWYEAPVFYFSNPASILGPGEELKRPEETEKLDFELEIAAVIGMPIDAQNDEMGIVGFTLFNDWSARDIQVGEMSVRIGPHKSKDFGTSIGPYIVTVDQLPMATDRLQISAKVEVNGQLITECDASAQHFGWSEIVDHARRNTKLRASDLLGSGTLNQGCLLEIGPIKSVSSPEGRWIEPGDIVTISCEHLGALTTPVV